MKKILARDISVITDLEGPWATDDNAFELFVEMAIRCGLGKEVGERAYRIISVMDDTWGDFGKVKHLDPSYSAGHTLKMILPLFKAMGATEDDLYTLSKNSVTVLPYTETVLPEIAKAFPTWIVSTSYEFFVQAFCNLIGFDFLNTYCTIVPYYDAIKMYEGDRSWILDFIKRIADYPIIEYDESGEIKPEHLAYYEEITSFFWEYLFSTKLGDFFRTVKPIGQAQKRDSLLDVCRRYDKQIESIVAVGDSNTDTGMFREVAGRGLAISVNGKGKACDFSDIMVIGADTRMTSWVIEIFAKHPRDKVINYLKKGIKLFDGFVISTPKNDPAHLQSLKDLSVAKRKEVRGVRIGELT